MKESLACVLNGHDWSHDYRRHVYVCKYCSGWATSIATQYHEGIPCDLTEVFYGALPFPK